MYPCSFMTLRVKVFFLYRNRKIVTFNGFNYLNPTLTVSVPEWRWPPSKLQNHPHVIGSLKEFTLTDMCHYVAWRRHTYIGTVFPGLPTILFLSSPLVPTPPIRPNFLLSLQLSRGIKATNFIPTRGKTREKAYHVG